MPPSTPKAVRPLSHSPYLTLMATAFGFMSLGFGINSILNPMSELSFFNLTDHASAASPVLINAMMVAFGAKLIGASAAIFATGYFGTKKALGAVVLAGGLVAGVDGWVCLHYMGDGEWNHWGYGGMMVGLGVVLMGALDGVF